MVSRSIVTLGLHNGDCAFNGCESHAERYHVTKYIEHPEYDDKSLYNDIALLRLDRSISFESRKNMTFVMYSL